MDVICRVRAIPVHSRVRAGDVSAVIRRVLLLGSGGLSIGQAGEFDYAVRWGWGGTKERRDHLVWSPVCVCVSLSVRHQVGE